MQIVTGTNHCIAVSEDGRCFTWGNGGFGRLGHRVQQDEYKPREVLEISAGQKQARFPTYAGSLLAAGTTSSLATTAPSGQLFVWGKLKANGDNQMCDEVISSPIGLEFQGDIASRRILFFSSSVVRSQVPLLL